MTQDEDTYISREGRVVDKGDSKQVTVKVHREYEEMLLQDIEKHRVYCRRTLRGEERDRDGPIWLDLNHGKDPIVEVRNAREMAMRIAADSYRGIAVRRRDSVAKGAPRSIQIGVRVLDADRARVRNLIRPSRASRIEALRNVVGVRSFCIYGMPPNLDKQACAEQMFEATGWPTMLVREIARAGQDEARWIVLADSKPPRDRYRVATSIRGDRYRTINIEEETRPKGGKGKKGWAKPTVGSGPKFFAPQYAMQSDQDDSGSAPPTEPYDDDAHMKDPSPLEQGEEEQGYTQGSEGQEKGWATPAGATSVEESGLSETERGKGLAKGCTGVLSGMAKAKGKGSRWERAKAKGPIMEDPWAFEPRVVKGKSKPSKAATQAVPTDPPSGRVSSAPAHAAARVPGASSDVSEERPTTWEAFIQSYWDEIQRRTAYEKEMAENLAKMTVHSELVMQMVNGLDTQNRHFQTQVTDLAARLDKLEAQLAAASREVKASVTPRMDGAATPPAARSRPPSPGAAAASGASDAMVIESGGGPAGYSPQSEDESEPVRRSKQPKLAPLGEGGLRPEGRERSPRRGTHKEEKQEHGSTKSS